MGRELVHGLYILVPLRDYHLAYLIKAVDLAIEYYEKKGIKNSATYCRNLRQILSTALSILVKETRKYNRFLKHIPLHNDPPIEEKLPEMKVYMDPNYRVR